MEKYELIKSLTVFSFQAGFGVTWVRGNIQYSGFFHYSETTLKTLMQFFLVVWVHRHMQK